MFKATGPISTTSQPVREAPPPHAGNAPVPATDVAPAPAESAIGLDERRSPVKLCGPDISISSGHIAPESSGAGLLTRADSDFPHIKFEYDAQTHPDFPRLANESLHFLFNGGNEGRALQNSFTGKKSKGHDVFIRPAQNPEQTGCRPELPVERNGKNAPDARADAQRAEQLAQKGRFFKGAGTNAGVRWAPGAENSSFDLARELVHARRIVKGTYTGGQAGGDPTVAGTQAFKEEQRATGLGKYARMSPSENSIRAEHGAALKPGTSPHPANADARQQVASQSVSTHPRVNVAAEETTKNMTVSHQGVDTGVGDTPTDTAAMTALKSAFRVGDENNLDIRQIYSDMKTLYQPQNIVGFTQGSPEQRPTIYYRIGNKLTGHCTLEHDYKKNIGFDIPYRGPCATYSVDGHLAGC